MSVVEQFQELIIGFAGLVSLIRRIIESEKPAHVTYELSFNP